LKHLKISMRRLSLAGLIIFAITAFNFSGFAAEPQRIALLPFKVNAEKDLSFLRDGVFDMLASRLAQENRVEVLDRGKTEEAVAAVVGSNPVNETKAREIGAKLNADYVLFGSLTVFGESVSMDANMVDVAGSRPTMTFAEQSQDLGAVITKINLIAADINAKLFGRVAAAETAPAPTQKAQPQAAAEGKSDIHAHPEKLLEGGVAGEDGSIVVKEAREVYQQFWRSGSFKHLINAVAIGDVDGDQKIETIVATPDTILIYRSDQGKFFKTAEIAESGSMHYVGVDVADINGNGYDEIFVTSLNSLKNAAVSTVLEYDGKSFNKIIENSSWFYRVADMTTRGPILLGQKHKTADPFSGAIFEMDWQNGGYAPLTEIKTPKDMSVMGLTLGDLENNRQDVIAAYRPDDKLQVFDPAGNEIWTGTERHGGSMLFYDLPKTEVGDHENRLYFPLRLRIWKDKNDKHQVIAVMNQEMTGMKIKFRKFIKSHIESLSWDGMGLVPNWRTRQVSGYISDFAIGDFDNDGRTELVAAVIIKEGSVAFTTPKSTIIAYELEPPS